MSKLIPKSINRASKMHNNIPSLMKAVLIKQNSTLSVENIPVPQPKKGEILIKMVAAPINPSDLIFINTTYSDFNGLSVPGLEGSGIAVKAGKGLLPHIWLGKRVACSLPSSGTWAEYTSVPASLCFPLNKNISFAEGSMSFINPLTALAFFDIAKKEKHKAIINTAAASSLGKMINKLGNKNNIPIINIVSKTKHIEILKRIGAKNILLSTSPDFLMEFQELSYNLNATLILDALAGKMASTLLKASLPSSTLVIYGFLSKEQITFDGDILLKDDKKIKAFWLKNWLTNNRTIKSLFNIWKTQKLIDNELAPSILKRFSLNEVQNAIDLYTNNMSAGKILLIPELK